MAPSNLPEISSDLLELKLDEAQELYQYRPLEPNEIRVLDLLPGTDQEEIIVQIRYTKLQDPLEIEFTALSYTWGDPKSTKTISCGDKEEKFIVTAECFSALHRLRLPDKVKTLWVDAICINQTDILERNHQVTLMSKIYHLSSKVAIYLGDEYGESKLALKYITDHYYHRFPMGLANMSIATMEAMQRLFSRPWFSRVWVIQEARNAKTAEVHCGDEVLSWNCILTLPWNAPYFPEASVGRQPFVTLPPPSYWKKRDYPYIGDILSPEVLFYQLLCARDCLATDPRDKVFALLPLFKDAIKVLAESDLLPNYAYSAERVFLYVAKYLLGSVGWALLYAVEGGSKLDLPSWCPDWSLLPATPLLYDFDRIPSKAHFPTAKTTSPPSLLENNILQIHAVRHSTITHLSTPCTLASPTWPSTIFENWWTFLITTYPIYNTETKPHTGLPTESQNGLGADTTQYLEAAYTFLSASRYDANIARHTEVRINTINAYSDPPRGDTQGYKQGQDRFKQRCQGQRVFLTGKGEVGLAPVEAEVGDVVVCVEGGTVPFLLRDVGDGSGKKVLVGKCEVMVFRSKEASWVPIAEWESSREDFVKGVLDGGVWEEILIV